MKTRKVTTIFGTTHNVPTNIVRIDSNHTHGWQLRFGRSKHFSDHTNDGRGARRALTEAKQELLKRIAKLPAPTGQRKDVNRNKSTDLPVGISGPIERLRAGKTTAHYYFQVTYPVFGAKPKNCSVYIGTENTYTDERYDAALEQAIAMRESGIRKHKLAATKAMRADAGIR